MEIWDVFDKDRNFLGKRILENDQKGLSHGEYTLATHVVIFNSNNEMLIQKRNPLKNKYPNMWDISIGGHSVQGETSSDTAKRKLFEKLRFEHDFNEDVPVMTIYNEKEIDDIYILKDEEFDLDTLKLKYEELQSVIWASKDEISQLIDEEKCIAYSKGFIELLYFNSNKRGIID